MRNTKRIGRSNEFSTVPKGYSRSHCIVIYEKRNKKNDSCYYPVQTIIFIRSGQDPVIDENDPETVAAAVSYLEREQYGQVGRFPRRYKGLPAQHEVVGAPVNREKYSLSQNRKYMFYNVEKQLDFFWNYQVKKMYWRYFLWQFAGRGNSTEPGVTAFGANNRQDGVDWSQFGLPLAFILGSDILLQQDP